MKSMEDELKDVLVELDQWRHRFSDSEDAHAGYVKAEERKGVLIRKIALSRNEECVFPLTQECPIWDYGAPLPKVFVNHRKAHLLYHVDADFVGTSLNVVELSTGDQASLYALLCFSNVRSCRVGEPNDENITRHPLWTKGLEGLDGGVVVNSTTVKSLVEMEGNAGNGGKEFWKNVKHYIFCFKDQMFECLADGFTVVLYRGTDQEMCVRVFGK